MNERWRSVKQKTMNKNAAHNKEDLFMISKNEKTPELEPIPKSIMNIAWC